MPDILRAGIRLTLGLLGCYWCLMGTIGAIMAGLDAAWGPALYAAFMTLLGYCLAYAAFVRMPWEPELASITSAAESVP